MATAIMYIVGKEIIDNKIPERYELWIGKNRIESAFRKSIGDEDAFVFVPLGYKELSDDVNINHLSLRWALKYRGYGNTYPGNRAVIRFENDRRENVFELIKDEGFF